MSGVLAVGSGMPSATRDGHDPILPTDVDTATHPTTGINTPTGNEKNGVGVEVYVVGGMATFYLLGELGVLGSLGILLHPAAVARKIGID
jgi:hypothetical protein